MAANSNIEWTEATWNPVTGCMKVASGCKNCYAERMSRRLKGMGQAKYRNGFGVVTCHEDSLTEPLHWRKPRTIFVCSMSDLYHRDVPFEFIDKAFAVMSLCPQHTFIELTKRWERMAKYFKAPSKGLTSRRESVGIACCAFPPDPEMIGGALRAGQGNWPLPNVQLGVSCSTQAELDAAWPYLRDTPAAVRVLSLEPLLERVELRGVVSTVEDGDTVVDYLTGDWVVDPMDGEFDIGRDKEHLDWVIVGCESGPNRRPCEIEHIESIVAQCQAAGVKCFVKQVPVNGRVSKDPAEWPESIRVRELPNG